LFATRYQGAEFAIAAGSIVCGASTDTSDLDLVVIYRTLKTAYREALTQQSMPVEAFVNDYETVQAFIDREYRNATATMIHMLATGIPVPAETDASRRLQRYARKLLEAGPQASDVALMERLRYAVSDLIDDLRGNPPPQELRAIMCALYPTIAELRLRRANVFVSGTGKHLARSLLACDAGFFARLDRVMRAAHSDGFGLSHIEELAGLLDALGGRLFDGYRQEAAADVRTEAKWYVESQ
jgi:predicted nucleotidyltransferase